MREVMFRRRNRYMIKRKCAGHQNPYFRTIVHSVNGTGEYGGSEVCVTAHFGDDIADAEQFGTRRAAQKKIRELRATFNLADALVAEALSAQDRKKIYNKAVFGEEVE